MDVFVWDYILLTLTFQSFNQVPVTYYFSKQSENAELDSSSPQTDELLKKQSCNEGTHTSKEKYTLYKIRIFPILIKKSLYTINEKKNTNEFIFVKTKHKKNIYCKVWPAYIVSSTFHKYGIAMYYIVMEENQIATTFVLFSIINTVTWPEKTSFIRVNKRRKIWISY